MRRLAGSSWDAGATTLQTATLALVHSTVEYCTPVWCRSAHTRLIDPIINDALRIVTGGLRPTPGNNLPILAGIQSAELRRSGATLSLKRRAMEPGHLFHSALTRPSSAVARRLKSRHPFVPVAQQLISFSENNNIRAEQWVVLNSCCILNMKRLVTLKYKQRKTSKASQESDLEACQWFHGITMISTNIGTPKVILPNGLKTKRMKLEQSDN